MFCGKPLNGSASERACSVGKNAKSWAIRGACRPWLLFPFGALDAYAAEVGVLVSDGRLGIGSATWPCLLAGSPCVAAALVELGRQRRREDAFQIIRPLRVCGAQEFVRDFAQASGQCAGDRREIGARMFAGDRAHRVDMLLDQRQRNAGYFGGVLEKPAETFGGVGDRRVTEGGRLSLDVMGGAKQLGMDRSGETLPQRVLPRRFETLAFGVHPCGE